MVNNHSFSTNTAFWINHRVGSKRSLSTLPYLDSRAKFSVQPVSHLHQRTSTFRVFGWGKIRLHTTNPTSNDSDKKFVKSNHSKDDITTRRKSLLHEVASLVFSAVGLFISASTALITDRDQFRRLKPTVEKLREFLEVSKIDVELKELLSPRLIQNFIILGRVEQESSIWKERSDFAQYSLDRSPPSPSIEESLRYMKYATAVYGSEMIQAAEVDARGIFPMYDGIIFPRTKKRISGHIEVPEEDITLCNMDYRTGHDVLRHFVAVDHTNRKVVLSIRGTFTLPELLDNFSGFSRPFCGGKAHSTMANKAEKIWEFSGETVLELLDKNEDYELIITGHSLGAGAACLLHILSHENDRSLVKGRPVRCFAFSSPPVFMPLEAVPSAVQNATNFIHENDVVPFLSVDSLRHLFSCLQVVGKATQNMTFIERIRLLGGSTRPSEDLIAAVENAQTKRLPPINDAPLLKIPAAASIWIRERHRSGKYSAKACDPNQLASVGPLIHMDMILDHVPARYEHALRGLDKL